MKCHSMTRPGPQNSGGVAKWLGLAMSATIFAGCVSMAKDVRLVAISADAQPGQSIGQEQGQDCAIRVFGFGKSATSLTANAAMANIQTEKGIRYMNGFSIGTSNMNIIMWRKDCIIASGEGFK